MPSMLKQWCFLYSILGELEKMYSDVEQVAKTFQNRNLHFTSKKSLNSWWSVNTGGEGKGGPKSGTLSSENIFSLCREHCRITWFFFKDHRYLHLKFVQLPIWYVRNTPSTGGGPSLGCQSLGHHAAILCALEQRPSLTGSFVVQPTKPQARSGTPGTIAKTTTEHPLHTRQHTWYFKTASADSHQTVQVESLPSLHRRGLRLQEDKHLFFQSLKVNKW